MTPRRPATARSAARSDEPAPRLNPRDRTLPRIASARIARDRMIPRGKRVLVAVSGGADSMALLRFLATEWMGEARFAVAHVNHGLRGRDANEDARLVRETARSLELPCYEATIPKGTLRAKGTKRGGPAGAAGATDATLPSEEAARRLRYQALATLAAEAGADRVATAHTADDQAETVLLRLARGAGLKGLAAMPSRGRVHGVRVIRPLLDVTREQVLAYLARHGATHREDASNASLAAARNAVRHEILPRLRERLNPSIRDALLREAALFREVNDYLEAEARRAYEICREAAPSGKIVLDRARLLTYPKLLRSYVFRFAVQELNGALRDFASTHVNALHSLVTQKSGRSAHLPLGSMARREGNRVVLTGGIGNRERAEGHPTLETSARPADR